MSAEQAIGRPLEGEVYATPVMVERRLYELSTELDGVVKEIQQAETDYLHAKSTYEIAFARAYLDADGKNQREREARALLECTEERADLVRAEALVRAHKENAKRLYTHVDVARSISVIVRAGMGAA